ncbi:MAG: LON peptidase substrate-binding domain-containing protein [Planctomycetota bacterium]|nr:LON peptidase substrate-binding domain-containing protein [Planctomycetota bacterium]
MESNSMPTGAPNGAVPVFPLANVYLFPGCVMPLHIFEPRYRQMIDDLLDRSGRLVMGTPREGETYSNGNPLLVDVGGLGEIGRHERLPDGRYLVWLFGLARVRIREVPSTRLYRQVECEPLVEIGMPADEVDAAKQKVQCALLARSPEFLNLPENLPLTHLVDLLTQRIPMPGSVMLELFREPDLKRRTERALSEHERRPTLPPSA